MTREQESYFAMALKTKNFSTQNATPIAAIPILSSCYRKTLGRGLIKRTERINFFSKK